MARDDMVDATVRQKCRVLFAQWANAYRNTAGLERIANLYKEFPKTSRPEAARQKVLREIPADPDQESPFAEPSSSSRSRSNLKDKQLGQSAAPSRPVTLTPTSSGFSYKLFKEKKDKTGKPFSLSKEKENMTTSIAQASIASTNLMNGLQLINRESERVSNNIEVLKRVEACKNLRRKILYYIQHVESDEWIGSLVNANDELVKALTTYEIMDRSISDDSDSDAWENADGIKGSGGHARTSSAQHQLAGLSLSEAPPVKPPRPAAPAAISMPSRPPVPAPVASAKLDDDDEDDDDPFGDSHAAKTPFDERAGMTWREV